MPSEVPSSPLHQFFYLAPFRCFHFASIQNIVYNSLAVTNNSSTSCHSTIRCAQFAK